jgi:hypothetical protein
VVQVAGWSSSVGCWWSLSTDPLAGPANLELATELPLQPDGLTRAVAWLERELQRPVAARDRRYGLARRRRWAVVLDDGYELPIRHRWLPGGGAAESGGGGMVPGAAARGGRVPGEAAALGGTALAGVFLGPGAWLLGLAVAAALGRWVLTALTPQLIGAPWTGPAVRALDLTAAAAPTGVPGRARPGRPTAALAARPPGRRRGRLGVDLAVGLGWLARFEPAGPGETTLVWYGVLVVATRASAVGLALVLVFVLLDRRPGLSRPGAQAGLAGAALLVLAWSMTIQVATSWLVPHLPLALVPGLLVAELVLGGFAGTALLAVAAADPQTLLRADGSPRPRVATAGNRNPIARRPNRGE